MKRLSILWIISILCFPFKGNCDSVLFPVPQGMENHVQFWVDVFTQYSTDQVLIFDSQNPEKIYRVVDLNTYLSNQERTHVKIKEIAKQARREVVSILKKLGGRAKSKDISEVILKANPKFDRSKTKVAVRQHLSRMNKENIILAEKSDIQSEGYTYYLKE